jgi:fused signal recognition particle receptor
MSDQQTERGGWWGSTLSKLKSALSKTKEVVVDSVVDHPVEEPFAVPDNPVELAVMPPPAPPPPPPPREIDDDYLEDLEEKLIKADLGMSTVDLLVNDLRKNARLKGWDSRDVEAFLKSEFQTILSSAPDTRLKLVPDKLNIVLVVGVNGTGKTTSIGKLCYRLKSQGYKVLMAAGDTFRAAAETQLEIWADRAGVDIVRLPEGSDPGAVIFQAMMKAKENNYDVVVIDTAGRLHNKANLMAELKKIRGVIDKHGSGLPLESLLVIDASTGQNGLQQAKLFMDACPLTGVILTKLDGSAKGGIVFSITRELKIPVKLIGLGEKIDDLRDFEPELFVEALF